MSIFLFVLSLIFAALYVLNKRNPQSNFSRGVLGRGAAIIALGLIISVLQPFKVERVDAGHVGIKVNLTGDDRGVSKFEYKTGWVIFNTWISKLYEFPTYQQHIEYPEQQVITKGGFSAVIKPSFNYSLKPGDVGDMFQNLRLDIKSIEQQWLQTAIVGTVNDVANKWAVDDIFNQREKFESDIVAEANKRVAKWFTISQLRTNIVPPQALQQSIEAKTKAIQEVQVAENQRLVAIAEGERKIAAARADSAAQVIAAAGEAEAIRRKQVSLNQTYIEYMKVEKWDGKLPSIQAGPSNGFIISPK
jgi:regulator of protease activity HflC (stomatin/prohibitin superfamily)